MTKGVVKIVKNWLSVKTLDSTISTGSHGNIETDKAINSTLQEMAILSGASHVVLSIF